MVVGSARAATYTTKVSSFAFSAAAANSLLSMISTPLVVDKAFADV